MRKEPCDAGSDGYWNRGERFSIFCARFGEEIMKPILFLLAVASACFFSSCVSIKDELFLQNIEVEGSPSQPAVHITPAETKAKSFSVAPHMSFSSGTFTTALERQYAGAIPDSLEDFQPTGLSWNLPRFVFGVDLDYTTSENLALTAAVTASIGKGRQLTSFYGGLGLLSADSGMSTRLDLGVQYIDIRYRGATVILRTVGTGPQDTIYYLDRGKQFQFNLYVNLTFNSTNKSFLNWFLQIGISPQSLTSFVPSKDASEEPGPYVVSDLRAESSVFWISATPGLYLSPSPNRHLLLGVRLMKELSSEFSKPGLVVIPMIQFDWIL